MFVKFYLSAVRLVYMQLVCMSFYRQLNWKIFLSSNTIPRTLWLRYFQSRTWILLYAKLHLNFEAWLLRNFSSLLLKFNIRKRFPRITRFCTIYSRFLKVKKNHFTNFCYFVRGKLKNCNYSSAHWFVLSLQLGDLIFKLTFPWCPYDSCWATWHYYWFKTKFKLCYKLCKLYALGGLRKPLTLEKSKTFDKFCDRGSA